MDKTIDSVKLLSHHIDFSFTLLKFVEDACVLLKLEF